jgi:hypothetical protein
MKYKTGVGYNRYKHGSNQSQKYESDIQDYADERNIDLLESFSDVFQKSAVTDTNITGLQDATQVVTSNDQCVLITATMRNIEESLTSVNYILKTKTPMLDTEDPEGDVVFNRKLLERAEKMIIHRREKHAQSVKRGQEKARRYNRTSGNNNIIKDAKLGSQAISENASEFRRKILPILREIRSEHGGVVTYEDYRRGLEERKIRTRTGNLKWQRSTIRNILKGEGR